MRKRIIIGTALLLLLAGVAAADRALGKPALSVILILFMSIQAIRELFGMSGVRLKSQMLLAQAATVACFGCRWFAHEGTLGLSAAEAILCCLTALMMTALFASTLKLQADGEEDPSLVHSASLAVFAFAYIAVPMSFLQDIAMREGVAFAALMVLASKCGDMGGYLVGSKMGRHRVMPRVSPKKSWEGSVGGLLLTLVVLFFAWRAEWGWLSSCSLPMLVLFGLVLNLATQAGDFAESMVKRCFKVKDSADLLPTFGGALDILDSLVFAMPVAALFSGLSG